MIASIDHPVKMWRVDSRVFLDKIDLPAILDKTFRGRHTMTASGKHDNVQEVSSDRMPCKPSTKFRYNDFVAGLGPRATYDDALVLLLELVKEPGESDHQAGRRLMSRFDEGSEAGNRKTTPVLEVALPA